MFLRNKIARVALLGALGLAGTSCDKILDQQPQSSLDVDQVFTDLAGANAALTGAYGGLTSVNYYGLRYPIFADLLADNLAHLGTFPSFAEFKNRNVQPSNAEVQSMWTAIYSTINRANNVIEYVPGISGVSDADKKRIVAEAKFIRALCYFDLVRYWQDVPLVLTPTKVVDGSLNVSRTPANEVYDQVKRDFDAAEADLPEGSPSRANKGAARALKARLALYRGQYTEAVTLADQVIATTKFSLLPVYRDNFDAENNPESIFEINFDNVTSSSYAFFLFPGSRGGRNEVGPLTTTLLTAYEPGDSRRNASISDGTFPVDGRLIPANVAVKYTKSGTGEDNFRVIRLAEVILISAEAKARTGDLAGSLTLLNRIRTRASFKPPFTGTMVALAPSTAATQADLLTAIDRERRVELAFEGHRWFDLVRTGRAQTLLSITEPGRLLLPLPFRETLNNKNLKQYAPY